ncbi:MAG: Rne/Rng family ribonuclease [Candidatus Cloacimonetes bacterium]|nr:Rne/Rng family ribonuclease [Candidatus Cloacimonadota bacterium]
MFNEIIVNVHPFEKRVAILEDSKLVELFVEKLDQQNIVGNIYKGRVKDVLPGMGAAFIDIGVDRTAFLHYSDIVTDFLDAEDENSEIPQHLVRDSSKIGKYLHQGQEIIVQVQKGPLGKKGARLTGQISIPGKFLVLFPNKSKIAISRKIQSYGEKGRIKSILSKLKHKDIGLIVRTEAEGCSDEDFVAEYNGIYKTWQFLERQITRAEPPCCIFNENDLSNTLIRDLYGSGVDRLIVDNKEFRQKLIDQLNDGAPELASRIEFYHEDSPIFDAYGIEKEIESIFRSSISLPSRGNIVIEPTEAMVSIEINTGSFTGKRNYDETVRRTNKEAAAEIVRQIRLRDLSGIMVIDFIDMRNEEHKDEVMQVLRKSLRRDRAKNRVFPFGPLGLVQITRKRTRPNLLNTYSEHCPCCNGTGRILSRDSVALKLYRWLYRSEYFINKKALRISVHPNVKEFLLNNAEYLRKFSGLVEIIEDDDLSPDKFKVYDSISGKELTSLYNT